MITPEEERLEEVANLQIQVMSQVLKDLREAAGLHEGPSEFYWFRYVDYAEVNREGEIECWTRGYGGDPTVRAGFSLKVDPQLLADGDPEAFKARFRAACLPLYNKLRAGEREKVAREVGLAQAKLAKLQGDIA